MPQRRRIRQQWRQSACTREWLLTRPAAACVQMEQSFAIQMNTGMMADNESDEVKRILLEGNPYLLVRTATPHL